MYFYTSCSGIIEFVIIIHDLAVRAAWNSLFAAVCFCVQQDRNLHTQLQLNKPGNVNGEQLWQ